jgi:hypothetical protein
MMASTSGEGLILTNLFFSRDRHGVGHKTITPRICPGICVRVIPYDGFLPRLFPPSTDSHGEITSCTKRPRKPLLILGRKLPRCLTSFRNGVADSRQNPALPDM